MFYNIINKENSLNYSEEVAVLIVLYQVWME